MKQTFDVNNNNDLESPLSFENTTENEATFFQDFLSIQLQKKALCNIEEKFKRLHPIDI